MSIKDYSTTAGSNTSIDGINIAEGCLPGNVNNAMRAMMADTRSFYQSGGWIDLGDTYTYASSTSFTVSSDVTAFYPVGQRVRAVGATTGTIYGKITASSYSAPNTTVTVSWDSGSLQSEALTVSVSFMTVTGSPILAGDVTGPASATDSAVALFDGTTGKALKNGVVIGTSANNIPQLDSDGLLSASVTFPVGLPFWWPANTPPSWALECDGSAISRTTYAELFSAIGTTFGTGDGSTTFNIPDLRAEFIRGWDNGRGVDSGRTFGSAQSGQIEAHTHTGSYLKNDGVGTGLASAGGTPVNYSGQIASTGGNETRPRNVALLPCIKY
ncbi:phage tail protein [Thalassospira sp.]|uniref:phage tail protein n=1 Tax=Thalassospira sp. TaxID=1912094 RepID=UPI00257B8A38|nr:phage tail protein [Thalassospira sp.]|tara:strand:+ start:7608 stop:8591 length:984 start_codon:yes stop_codon:yes gene_type:complete